MVSICYDFVSFLKIKKNVNNNNNNKNMAIECVIHSAITISIPVLNVNVFVGR